jgi:Spy/CpxP family protein refolding chaperone
MSMRLLLTVVVAFGPATIASAQRGGGGATGMHPGDQIINQSAPSATTKMDAISKQLKLTRDQKKQIQSIFDEAHKGAAPLRKQILEGRAKIADAILEGKSQPEIDEIVSSEGALMGQMAATEMRAFADLYKTLKPDQQQKAGQILPMMAGIFDQERAWDTPVH